MTSAFVTFAISLAIAAILTPLVLRWATARRYFDSPDERKVHVAPIPRLGGIAIVIAFFTPLTGLALIDVGMTGVLQGMGQQLIGLYVGGLLITAVGLYDDFKGANAVQKLVVQIAVALLMYQFGYQIKIISSPFGGNIELGALSVVVTVLWFVGVMNAVNLIDGLDGLAGGIGFISISTLLALSALNQNMVAVLLCAALAGALGGFLIYNFNPARIFMGDTGSLFLGFVLAALSISSSTKGSTTVALTIPILILGLPILDTAMAIGRRIRKRRPIFSADQDHIHHKLLRAGLSHRGAVLALYGLALVLALAAIGLRFRATPEGGAVLGLAGLMLLVVLLFLNRHRSSPRELVSGPDSHGLEARARVDQLGQALDEATDALALGHALEHFAADTRLAALEITDGSRPIFGWLRATTNQEQLYPLVRYRIPLAGRGEGAAATALLTLHFFQLVEPHDNYSVVMPWERLAPALVRNLDRLAWARLQPQVVTLAEAPQPTADFALTVARTLTGQHARAKSA